MQGASLTGVDLTESQLDGVLFRKSELIGTHLSGVKLSGVEMDDANLSGANLVSSNLNGSVLSLSDLSGANLRNVSITGAWINMARLVGADLDRANLSASTFFGTDLTGANLQNAKLNGANLIGANLSGTDLRGADLTGAILKLPVPPDTSPTFTYQDLTGPDLFTALNQTEMAKVIADSRVSNLTEVRLKPLLKDAILQGVIYDETTTWPLGYVIPSSAIFMNVKPK